MKLSDDIVKESSEHIKNTLQIHTTHEQKKSGKIQKNASEVLIFEIAILHKTRACLFF